jgi:hypothetical protein
MLGKNPPDDVLINRGSECQIDLIGDLRTSPGRIALFHFDNGANEVGIWTFWTGLGCALMKTAGDTFAVPARDGNSTTSMALTRLPRGQTDSA